jgi:uncharacterized membrane protein
MESKATTLDNRKLFTPLKTSLLYLTIVLVSLSMANDYLPKPEDIYLYYDYSTLVYKGSMPYRDFLFEYPPFALPFLLIPNLPNVLLGSPSFDRYMIFYHFEAYLLTFGILLISWYLLRDLLSTEEANDRVPLLATACILFSFFIFRRFDIAAAFLFTLTIYLIHRKKPAWGGLVLGLATATKLYPAVAVPFLLIYFWRVVKDRKSTFYHLGGVIAGVLIAFLPFVLLSFNGLVNFLKYHSERNIQSESFWASFLMAARTLNLTTVVHSIDHGSSNLVSPWNPFLSSLSLIIMAAGYIIFFCFLWWQAGSPTFKPSTIWLINAISVAIIWFILTNKVFSPQYLVWLLPFTPFWKGTRALIFMNMLALSFLIYPNLAPLIVTLEWLPFSVIMVRNILLLILLFLEVRALIKPDILSSHS